MRGFWWHNLYLEVIPVGDHLPQCAFSGWLRLGLRRHVEGVRCLDKLNLVAKAGLAQTKGLLGCLAIAFLALN